MTVANMDLTHYFFPFRRKDMRTLLVVLHIFQNSINCFSVGIKFYCQSYNRKQGIILFGLTVVTENVFVRI